MIKLLVRMKRNFFFSMLVLCGGLVLFVLFLLTPKLIETRGLGKEVRTLQSENERIQGMFLSSTGHSGEQLERIQNQLRKRRAMVPYRERLPRILDKIASVAQMHGLNVLSLKPLSNRPYREVDEELLRDKGREVYEVYIGMKAEGRFNELGRYLSHLEKSPVKIIINQIELKTLLEYDPDSRREPELAIRITMSILMKFLSEEAVW